MQNRFLHLFTTAITFQAWSVAWGSYLNGGGGDLEVMELPERAVSVDEIGCCQLVEGFEGQRTGCSVGGGAILLTSAKLAFVHENGQGLLAWSKARQKWSSQLEKLINPNHLQHELAPSRPVGGPQSHAALPHLTRQLSLHAWYRWEYPSSPSERDPMKINWLSWWVCLEGINA